MQQHGGSQSDERYRRWWLVVVAALVSTGMFAAAAASLIALVDSFVVFALVGAAAVLLVGRTDLPVGHRVGGQQILAGALAAGTSVGTLSGLYTILGASVVAVALVLVIASPWIVGADWRWLDYDADTVMWGLCYSGTVPLRFQLQREVQAASDAGTSMIDWDELLRNQDDRR